MFGSCKLTHLSSRREERPSSLYQERDDVVLFLGSQKKAYYCKFLCEYKWLKCLLLFTTTAFASRLFLSEVWEIWSCVNNTMIKVKWFWDFYLTKKEKKNDSSYQFGLAETWRCRTVIASLELEMVVMEELANTPAQKILKFSSII